MQQGGGPPPAPWIRELPCVFGGFSCVWAVFVKFSFGVFAGRAASLGSGGFGVQRMAKGGAEPDCISMRGYTATKTALNGLYAKSGILYAKSGIGSPLFR